MILAERTARLEAEAKLANARAEAALIAYYKLEIEKLRRALYGTRSERKARLLEQMELELEELEATATEDEVAAEKAAAQIRSPGSLTFLRVSPTSRKAGFQNFCPGTGNTRTCRPPLKPWQSDR
jgi:transposase